jgi:hypothetical protein
VVRPDPLHPVSSVLLAPPEVAAAYDDGYLNSLGNALLYHVTDLSYDIKVETAPGITREGLSADLQQHSFILRFTHVDSLLYFALHLEKIGQSIFSPYSTLIFSRRKEENKKIYAKALKCAQDPKKELQKRGKAGIIQRIFRVSHRKGCIICRKEWKNPEILFTPLSSRTSLRAGSLKA